MSLNLTSHPKAPDTLKETRPNFKVLLADMAIHPAGIDLLAEQSTLVKLPSYSPEAEVLEAARDVDAILARTCVISAPIIHAAPRLKIVSRHGVGYDNVDIGACTRHGIAVSITEGSNAESVSEHAFACILAVANRLIPAHASTRVGQWERDEMSGLELHGKTLGIFGLGRIGARTAKHALAFDMEVLACDPYISQREARSAGATLVPSDTLLRQSDFISIHVPLTAETRHMIGSRELELMKPRAILVNTARGGIIDEEALCQALSAGHLYGAALDVFEEEPVRPDHPLLQLDNLICSPHVAGVTAESMLRTSVAAAENILHVLHGEKPSHLVNPEVLKNHSRITWCNSAG